MTCMFSDWKLTNLKDIPQIPWPWCQLGWQSRERGERRRGQVHAELLPPEWFRKPPTSRTGTPAILGEYQADQVLVDTQGQLVTQGDHPRGGNERPIHTKPLALAHLGYVVSKNIEIQVEGMDTEENVRPIDALTFWGCPVSDNEGFRLKLLNQWDLSANQRKWRGVISLMGKPNKKCRQHKFNKTTRKENDQIKRLQRHDYNTFWWNSVAE